MDETAMTLFDHIKELRARLLRAAGALLIGAVAGSFLSTQAISILTRPVKDVVQLIVLSPTEAPILYFKIALFLGFVIALPYILYQIYAFLRPGLLPNERRIFHFTLPGFVLLFVLGDVFTLTVLIPLSIPVLMGFLQKIATPTYSLEQYLTFVTTLLLWMGLLFQTPLVMFGLALLGVVNANAFKKARKFVIFGAALLAAIITPTTDPVTMLLVTGPFIILYEIGILLAQLARRPRVGRG